MFTSIVATVVKQFTKNPAAKLMNPPVKRYLAASALSALAVICTYAAAVEITVSQAGMAFDDAVNTVTVTGPNGYLFTSNEPDGTYFVGLGDAEILADGQYVFEVTTIVYGGLETINDTANGRENVTRQIVISSERKSGTFRVVNGSVVDADQEEAPQ